MVNGVCSMCGYFDPHAADPIAEDPAMQTKASALNSVEAEDAATNTLSRPNYAEKLLGVGSSRETSEAGVRVAAAENSSTYWFCFIVALVLIACIFRVCQPDGAFVQGLLVVCLFIGVIGAYFLPTIAAESRKHKNAESILIVNLFLGWTFLGWVIALAWAFTSNTHLDMDGSLADASIGGEQVPGAPLALMCDE
jgi:hypothetical protein